MVRKPAVYDHIRPDLLNRRGHKPSDIRLANHMGHAGSLPEDPLLSKFGDINSALVLAHLLHQVQTVRVVQAQRAHEQIPHQALHHRLLVRQHQSLAWRVEFHARLYQSVGGRCFPHRRHFAARSLVYESAVCSHVRAVYSQ